MAVFRLDNSQRLLRSNQGRVCLVKTVYSFFYDVVQYPDYLLVRRGLQRKTEFYDQISREFLHECPAQMQQFDEGSDEIPIRRLPAQAA